MHRYERWGMMLRVRRALAAFTMLGLILASRVDAQAAPLVPAAYGDFDHYTFALTWQPGICTADCMSDQPHLPLIGLHGLWASRPQSLVAQNVPEQSWWARGCDFYHHSDEAPALSADLEAKLATVMPHFKKSLLTHEYDKHVQCFGFDPTLFFTTELAMRQAVADSPFGKYLVAQTGATVAHADVIAAFEHDFGTTDARSLNLQCERDGAGREVLTQFWITIRTSALGAFPAAASLTDTPIDQDTCPATFLIPSWDAP
jgi:ribonuclease I